MQVVTAPQPQVAHEPRQLSLSQKIALELANPLPSRYAGELQRGEESFMSGVTAASLPNHATSTNSLSISSRLEGLMKQQGSDVRVSLA